MAWRVNVVKLGAENLFPLLGALKERQNMKENITWAEAEGADTMTRVCQECRGTQAVLLESPRIRFPPMSAAMLECSPVQLCDIKRGRDAPDQE